MSEFYKNEKQTQARVGILFLVSIIILIASYAWLQDYITSYQKQGIIVHFKNANNLEAGSAVTIFGMKSGKVKSVSLAKDGVLVSLQINKKTFIPEKSEFFIKETNLMGEREVEILLSDSKKEINKDKIQEGKVVYGSTTLIANLNEMIIQLNSMMNMMSKQTVFFDSFKKLANNYFEIIDKISNFLKINDATIQNAFSNINESSNLLKSILEENKGSINGILTKTDSSLTKAQISFDELNEFIDEVHDLTKVVKSSDGTLYKVINDKELYNNLLNSSARLDSLLIDVKKNPKKYFKIGLF